MRVLVLLVLAAGCRQPGATSTPPSVEPARTGAGRVPIELSVMSKPSTTVIARSVFGEERVLGVTPLDRVPGAFVGDVIVLQNDDKRLRYEERIEFGAPGEHKTIVKVFEKK